MSLAIRHALRTSERATLATLAARATLAAQFTGRFQTAARLKTFRLKTLRLSLRSLREIPAGWVPKRQLKVCVLGLRVP